jgi:hypothetical protein
MHAGGATCLASSGATPAIIQAAGRWASNTFQIYIQKNPILLQASCTWIRDSCDGTFVALGCSFYFIFPFFLSLLPTSILRARTHAPRTLYPSHLLLSFHLIFSNFPSKISYFLIAIYAFCSKKIFIGAPLVSIGDRELLFPG